MQTDLWKFPELNEYSKKIKSLNMIQIVVLDVGVEGGGVLIFSNSTSLRQIFDNPLNLHSILFNLCLRKFVTYHNTRGPWATLLTWVKPGTVVLQKKTFLVVTNFNLHLTKWNLINCPNDSWMDEKQTDWPIQPQKLFVRGILQKSYRHYKWSKFSRN